MDTAFVLGAGLGTRLRPLTDQLPKPLIPFFHRPLITYAFDHLRAAGVESFIVNTHHLPDEYPQAFPQGSWEGAPLTFRYEPTLLETAGGIANIADLVADRPFIVYNGDILTTLPLAPLIAEHKAQGNLVTLALRTQGPGRHVAYDQERGLITDIRNRLGTGDQGSYQFTGVYVVSPEFLRYLTPGKIESVIPVWLERIAAGQRIGGVVVDEGIWWDLGDRASYLAAHQAEDLPIPHATDIHPDAQIHLGATLRGRNIIGPGAIVEQGATLVDSILWPGAVAAEGASLTRCIVRGGCRATGTLSDTDV